MNEELHPTLPDAVLEKEKAEGRVLTPEEMATVKREWAIMVGKWLMDHPRIDFEEWRQDMWERGQHARDLTDAGTFAIATEDVPEFEPGPLPDRYLRPETRAEKLDRQRRLAFYRQEATEIWNQQKIGKGKSLTGESWAHGFGIDDYVREQEIRYQVRILEEAIGASVALDD